MNVMKNKFEIGDEVRVVNSWDEKLYDRVGTVNKYFDHTDEYLVVFPQLGMSILHETELVLFNKVYERELCC